MAKGTINNVKLGAFVLGGLIFLVFLLYTIGKNGHLFGATYTLKAMFTDAQGLVEGNNVRFSGINVGTVKKIKIRNDALIEVTMVIDENMMPVIRKNAVVAIGTEGLVGNKVINIVPGRQVAVHANEGDVLAAKRAVNTDEIMETLYHTNNDVAVIAVELRTTVQRINNSTLWSLMDDKTIPLDLKTSMANIRTATGRAADLTESLDNMITDVKNGKGSVGMLLKDTAFASDIGSAIRNIKSASASADSFATEINHLASSMRERMLSKDGLVHALFRDSTMVKKLNVSLDNIQQGTDGFNQNMEALKHNFLLRGYFRKQEEQKAK